MFDNHDKIVGIMPFIYGIPSYTIFVGLGLLAGVLYYLVDAGRRKSRNEGAIIIVAAGLIFGFIGSKVPLLFESTDLTKWIVGKSIVGGLVGGALGVFLVKRALNIKMRMGNIIAPAVALGMSIGRLGCFFNGCCYGKEGTWGFDFGDGVLRLPTQLFEAAFHVIAFVLLVVYKDKVKTPGILFKVYVLSYFIFRFFIEFIRENPHVWLGMSIYQLICLPGIAYLTYKIMKGGKEYEPREI